jgi:hypothetical protein
VALRVALASLALISIPRVALAHVGGVVVIVYVGSLSVHAILCLAIAAFRTAFLDEISRSVFRRVFWVSFLTPLLFAPIVLVALAYVIEWADEPVTGFAWYRFIGTLESATSFVSYPFILAFAAALGWYLSKPRTQRT